jgi:hypothetical protein
MRCIAMASATLIFTSKITELSTRFYLLRLLSWYGADWTTVSDRSIPDLALTLATLAITLRIGTGTTITNFIVL